jgi:hypothetical protein
MTPPISLERSAGSYAPWGVPVRSGTDRAAQVLPAHLACGTLAAFEGTVPSQAEVAA